MPIGVKQEREGAKRNKRAAKIVLSYILYPYQQQIVDEIPRRLAQGGAIVQSPPRSGKSKIIDATVQRICKAGKVAVVLTHRAKIQSQLIDHCSGISIDAKTDHIFVRGGHCYVAMIQSLINRPFIMSQLETLGKSVVLLIDECHDGSFNKVMDALPAAHRIGFSATPAWKWAKFMPKYYASLIHGPQISELQTQGRFVPVDYYEMVSDLEGLKRSANGEYTEASQDTVFGRAKLYDGLFTELAKFSFNKCAIFCASKKSADSLAEQFKAYPQWTTALYYSGLPSYNLAQFTTLGRANVLITVRSLGVGWDYPPLDFTVLWCAMGSLVSFLQTGARPCTPMPGKNRVTELDFGGNNTRFGGTLTRQALTMDRDWNALWLPPDKPPRDANGVAAIKNCPQCDFIVSALSRSCPNCGFTWNVEDVALKEGELVQIQHEADQRTASVTALAGRRISTLTAPELALWARERDKKAFGMRVAKALTITNPQYAVEYGRAAGYNSKWADRVLQEICEVQMYEPEYKIPFADIVVK